VLLHILSLSTHHIGTKSRVPTQPQFTPFIHSLHMQPAKRPRLGTGFKVPWAVGAAPSAAVGTAATRAPLQALNTAGTPCGNALGEARHARGGQ
jgi:hypothetical protein